MTQYEIRARVILSGVVVTVEAETAEEAAGKARAGVWYNADYDVAERADWSLEGKMRKINTT